MPPLKQYAEYRVWAQLGRQCICDSCRQFINIEAQQQQQQQQQKTHMKEQFVLYIYILIRIIINNFIYHLKINLLKSLC